MGTVAELPQDRGLTVAEVHELLERIHSVELSIERLAGEVSGLAKVKTAEATHMLERIEEVDHKRRNTDRVVTALHDRLDKYPPAEDLHRTVREFAALKNRLLGGIVVGMALGVGSGTAISQLILGG